MKQFIYQLAKEVFQVMLVGNLLFLIMELTKPRSVLAYLNLNLWLVIWLISGIIVLLNVKTKS
jgi:hypothetical protein